MPIARKKAEAEPSTNERQMPSSSALLFAVLPLVAGQCTNTCYSSAWISDGYCDDGGPGSEYGTCAYGTDCTDCGPRGSSSPPPSPSPPPPSPSPPPPGSSTACSGYAQISTGTCVSHGHTDIISSSVCESAVAAVNLAEGYGGVQPNEPCS